MGRLYILLLPVVLLISSNCSHHRGARSRIPNIPYYNKPVNLETFGDKYNLPLRFTEVDSFYHFGVIEDSSYLGRHYIFTRTGKIWYTGRFKNDVKVGYHFWVHPAGYWVYRYDKKGQGGRVLIADRF